MSKTYKIDYDRAIGVYNAIPCGRHKAIKRTELSKKTGYVSRKIRMYTHFLRLMGHFVMSNSKYGIYRASEDRDKAIDEINEYIKHQQSYIIDIQANITAAKKELDKIYSAKQEVL